MVKKTCCILTDMMPDPKKRARSTRVMARPPKTIAVTLDRSVALRSDMFGRNGLTTSCRIIVAMEHNPVLMVLKRRGSGVLQQGLGRSCE